MTAHRVESEFVNGIWRYERGPDFVDVNYPCIESTDKNSIISHVGLYLNADAFFLRTSSGVSNEFKDQLDNGLFLYDNLNLINEKMKIIIVISEHDKLFKELTSIHDLEIRLNREYSNNYRMMGGRR